MALFKLGLVQMLGEKAKSPKERALMAQQWQCFGSALEN
jgi:hypothetical protein